MKNKTVPMRRCIGCMESMPKDRLVRIACYEGKLSLDTDGRTKGRGVYVCPRKECIEKAIKKNALKRSLKADIGAEEAESILQSVIDREEG